MNQPITAKMGVCEVKTMRLIDVDALLDTTEHLAQGCFGQGQCYYERTNVSLITFLQLIKKQPTLDAVQVVRCRDCKYFVKNTWECVRLSDRFGDEYSDARVYPEYYCADGERKDDGK